MKLSLPPLILLSAAALFMVSCGKDWEALGEEYSNPGLARSEVLKDFREPAATLNGVWQRPRAEFQRIVLPVKIKGTELNLIFDTGWVGPVWIFKDQRERLNLQPMETAEPADKDSLFKGEFMEAGGFLIWVPSFRGDLSEKKEDLFGVEGFDGIMGIDLFRDFKITLKPRHNQLVLSLLAESEPDAQKMEYRMFPRPVVKGSLDGTARFFLLDSGYPAEGHLGRWNRPAGWIAEPRRVDHPLADVQIEVVGRYGSQIVNLLGIEIPQVQFQISEWVNWGQKGADSFARDSLFDIIGLGVLEDLETVLNMPRREISLRAYGR